jgi:HEPN domain-containing protein
MSSQQPDRRAVALRWLRWAREDLTLATRTAADHDVVARGACIWAHQAAEKALKAVLADRDVDPPRLHDLDRLVQRLPDTDRGGFAQIDLPELTRWAIEGRYPAELDEATTEDAHRVIAIARSVLDEAERLLAASRD